MRKKIISAILAVSMGVSALPVLAAHADEGNSEDADYSFVTGAPFYTEDFEEDNFVDVAKSEQKGWIYNPGGGAAFDRGDNFNNVQTGSNMIRFCGTQWDDSSLELNFKESAKAKGIQEDDYNSYIENNVAVSFSYSPTADGNVGNKQDGSRNMIELLADDGNPFMAFEAYTKDKQNDDITLNLIALNEDKTANVRYELAKGASNVFDILRNVTVYMNSEDNTYQVKVGTKPLTIGSFGEWIPMSTSDNVGNAAQASGVKIGSVKINNIHSSWYGGIVLDDVELANWNIIQFTNPASEPDKAMSLWYRKPAERWAESIPLGNGRIGAMVWGGIQSDTVSLNDVTAWSGQAQTGLDKDGSADNYAALNALREELKKDSPDRSKVEQYIKEMGGEGNPTTGTHRPFGELSVDFKGIGNVISGYRRSLDMENAVSAVEFEADGTKYTRETIVSNPDDVIAIKYTAAGSGKISFDAALTSDNTNGGTGSMSVIGDDEKYIEWNGAVANNDNVTNGVNTFAYMQAIPTGGTVTYDNSGIHVEDANEVVILVSLGTDFTAGTNFIQNTKDNCKSQLDAAAEKGYDSIKDAHVQDVSKLFDRMTVEIGPQDELISKDPTDVRLEKIRNGAEIDGSFMSLWYQYARYLMIAGSRENSPMPMNLQGIWNDGVASSMAWTCDYHLDINTQMNQWMANSANLSESEKPIFNFMKNILIPNGQITAQKQYGVSAENGGWLAGVATNAWGHTGISKDSWQSFTGTTCGAWLAQEIMSYYDHTGDKDFLENEGFEMLKQTAAFYNEFMTEYTDSEGHTYWVTIPSSSPEHGQLEMMSTMDITIVGDIFDKTMECYDILNETHDDFYEAIKAKREGMPSYKVMSNGSLAEWPYRTGTDDENMGVTNHRHTSHLLGLFPYAQITPDKTPELAQAALKSMHLRYDREDFENTEWTLVNEQGQYARLKDGESAYEALKMQANTYTWPNLLSISPEGIALAPCDVYCIDGTFGTGAATAEMLLQSHSDRLEFLPALPKEWSEGSIEGMSAEGAITVDFSWKNYMLTSAEITSKNGGTVNILKNAKVRWDDAAVYDENGSKVETSGNDKLLTFTAEAGKSYTLKSASGAEISTGRIINDDYPGISYNNFGYNSGREGLNDFGNDVHYSEHEGSSIEFTFNGTGIDVLAEMHKGGGKKVKITIDNEDKGEYANTLPDNADSEYQAHGIVYSADNLDAGSHTIKIEQTEDGGYFEFDAFAVKGQYFEQINDDDPRITYESGWSRNEGRSNGDYMADIHFADNDNVGKSLTVEFEGTGIETIVEKDGIFGELAFEIDGQDYGTDDTSDGKGGNYHIVNPISGLPNGKHTLKVTHLGKDGTWNWCAIDGFIILNDGSATIETGTYELTGIDSGKLLTADGDGIKTTDNKNGADYQKWILSYINDRQFRLINAHSGMAVSLDGDMLVQKQSDPTDETQVWEKVEHNNADGTFWLFSEVKGSYTNVYGGNCNDGDDIGLWSNGGTPEYSESNWWSIEDAGDGTVLLKSPKNKTPQAYMTLDPNNSDTAGARIKTYAKRSDVNQIWTIEFVGDGKYVLKNEQNGKYAAKVNGELALVDNASENNAKWMLEQGRQNGTLYSVFTNADDSSTLNIDGEKWGMTSASASNTAPYVYGITTDGKISAGETVNVSYKYSGNVSEGSSKYRVYGVASGIQLFSMADGDIAEGTANASDGFSFTVPEDYSAEGTIVIEITPVTSKGTSGGSFYKYIKPVTPQDRGLNGKVQDTVIFDINDIENRNGYEVSGSHYEVDVCDKADKENCLAVTATQWFEDSYARLDLASENNDYSELTGKAYVEFNAFLDAPDNYDKESRMYVALKDGDNIFASVRLFSRRLDIMALDSKGNYRKNYNIALGADNIYKQWFNFKFYVDTENQRFAVKVNDEFVTTDGKNIWFTPAQNSIEGYPGTDSKSNAAKISAIEIGHKWSGAPSTIYVNDLKLGTYGENSDNSWVVDSFDAVNGTLEYGAENQMSLTIVENEPVEKGIVYTALYNDGVLVSLKKLEDITFDARGVYETIIGMNVPKVGGNYTAKVFIWDDNMKPLGSAYEKKFNVESPFTIPNVFSDNMIIQADEDITVWGTAKAGDEVTAVLTGASEETASALADDDGNWTITLPAQTASVNGETYTLTVKCGNETKTYTNVIFGDVYLLAGQSNMEAWMSWIDADNIETQKERAENPNIRTVDLLGKGTDGSADPTEDLPKVDGTEWKPMTYTNVQSTSAIGYYFAQELNEDTGRPIGYIQTAVGGTGIARWLRDDYVNGVSGYPWSLYNNRVYPIRNLKLSGVLYYQGEAEGPNGQDSSQGWSAEKYSTVMAALIDNYRELFKDDDLPFYYAQLARYSNQNFELIRAAQVWALDKVSNPEYVRIVSNLDIVGNFGAEGNTSGNARHDIHPYDKEKVAGKFALLAKYDIYGMTDAPITGPMYKSMETDGDKLILTFDASGDLAVMDTDAYADYKTGDLIISGELDTSKLNGFEIAGEDGIYYPADAEISGNTVILTSSDVTAPVKARYAFGSYPESPNLTDESGLPSYTFATEYTTKN